MPLRLGHRDNVTCTVIKDWTATYPDSIRVAAGEAVALDGREDIWDGHRWLWARNRDGKEGWVPACIVAPGNPARVTENYDAGELTCRAGQALTAERSLNGWVRCSDRAGNSGWVPERNLRPGAPSGS